jgi:hypothetical protein
MKVVINGDFGGFSLSDEAFEKFLYRKGIAWEKCINKYDMTDYYHARHLDSEEHYLAQHEVLQNRADPDLVAVVEEMGHKANGQYANLVIVEIPDNVQWHLAEYDGVEHIAENHRTWGPGYEP